MKAKERYEVFPFRNIDFNFFSGKIVNVIESAREKPVLKTVDSKAAAQQKSVRTTNTTVLIDVSLIIIMRLVNCIESTSIDNYFSFKAQLNVDGVWTAMVFEKYSLCIFDTIESHSMLIILFIIRAIASQQQLLLYLHDSCYCQKQQPKSQQS